MPLIPDCSAKFHAAVCGRGFGEGDDTVLNGQCLVTPAFVESELNEDTEPMWTPQASPAGVFRHNLDMGAGCSTGKHELYEGCTPQIQRQLSIPFSCVGAEIWESVRAHVNISGLRWTRRFQCSTACEEKEAAAWLQSDRSAPEPTYLSFSGCLIRLKEGAPVELFSLLEITELKSYPRQRNWDLAWWGCSNLLTVALSTPQ